MRVARAPLDPRDPVGLRWVDFVASDPDRPWVPDGHDADDIYGPIHRAGRTVPRRRDDDIGQPRMREPVGS